MLVGKRNLVVRLGKEKAVVLLKSSLAAVFALLILGIILRTIPFWSIAALVTIPWILKSLAIAGKNYDNSKAFRFAVNTIVITLSLAISFPGGQAK
jgi:1,4-dihydroxy-2-naphthoate octaprenyltransferase